MCSVDLGDVRLLRNHPRLGLRIWWGRRDSNPGSLGLASVVVDPEPSILARLDYGPNNT